MAERRKLHLDDTNIAIKGTRRIIMMIDRGNERLVDRSLDYEGPEN